MLTPGEAEALRLGLTAEQIGQKSGGISAGYVKRILAKGCDDEYRLEAVERTLSLLGKLTAHPKRTISRKLLLAASIGAAKKMKSDEEEPNTTHLRLD